MGDVRTAGPNFEPVDIRVAKSHLRVDADDTSQHEMLAIYCTAAREHIEQLTRRVIADQTRVLTLPEFPVDEKRRAMYATQYGWDAAVLARPRLAQCDAPIRLRPPVQSVASVTYLDPTGATQTLSPSAYVVDLSAYPPVIVPAPSTSWPDTLQDHPAAVTVTYQAGETDSESVPSALIAAILLTVGDLYENREAQIAGMTIVENPTVLRLVGPHTLVEFA